MSWNISGIRSVFVWNLYGVTLWHGSRKMDFTQLFHCQCRCCRLGFVWVSFQQWSVKLLEGLSLNSMLFSCVCICMYLVRVVVCLCYSSYQSWHLHRALSIRTVCLSIRLSATHTKLRTNASKSTTQRCTKS